MFDFLFNEKAAELFFTLKKAAISVLSTSKALTVSLGVCDLAAPNDEPGRLVANEK